MTAWRDLADQLTASQIERLADMEEHSPWSADETAEALLNGARKYAAENLTESVMFGHIAAPADATATYPWHEPDGEGGLWSREFTGTGRSVAGVSVTIEGNQFADGSVVGRVMIGVNDLPTSTGGELGSAEDARQLAAALIDAADEIERLK